jgi:DNA helicase-2/ATP-dependent DNA helicase PcrA
MIDAPLTEWLGSTTISDVLLSAPPGCGKTQALADRAGSIVRAGLVRPPQQILAITFSNKAKANLAARLRGSLGPSYRRYVYVSNFHGLGARFAQSHGAATGHPRAELQTSRTPLRRLKRQVCSDFNISINELERCLSAAKRGAFTDAEVLERLSSSMAALDYEARIRAASISDYDDLIRLGLLVMANEVIVNAYRERFCCLLVDETQDLSIAQFELIEGLGKGRTVFAGDRAQGIYGFAGAAPKVIYDRVAARSATSVTLRTSYRSAPRIVEIVSRVSEKLGGDPVDAAADQEWPHDGQVVIERYKSTGDEAVAVLGLIKHWLATDPEASIGIMVRAGERRAVLDRAVQEAALPAEVWDNPAHSPGVVTLLRRHVERAVSSTADRQSAIDELFLLCAADARLDPDLLERLKEAIDDLDDDITHRDLVESVSAIRIDFGSEAPTPAGLHLLNAHLGKGQQFDYVIILGLEEGHIPDRRAATQEEHADELSVFHVMVSRARHTVVFTCCARVAHYGMIYARNPSRYLGVLEQLSTGWIADEKPEASVKPAR